MSYTLTRQLQYPRDLLPGCAQVEAKRPTSGSDPTPVPAASTTLELYRRAAVTIQTVTLLEGMTEAIPVSDAGQVLVGDVLALAALLGVVEESLYVSAIAADRSSITVQYGGKQLVVQAGSRLIPTGTRPQMYTGSVHGTPVSSVVTDAAGRAEFFTRPREVEVVAIYPASTGLAPTSFGYSSGAAWAPFESHVSVRDFSSIQAAIDALPSTGGRVYVPAGEYTVPTGGLRIAKPIELFGDGPGRTVLRPFTKNADQQPVIVIDTSAGSIDHVVVRDMKLGNATAPSARYEHSHGIGCVTTANTKLVHFTAERVDVESMAGDGIHLEGANPGTGAIVFVRLQDCTVSRCQGSGYFIERTAMMQGQGCYANGCQLFGAYCNESHIAWYVSAFENNCQRVTPAGQPAYAKTGLAGSIYNPTYGAQLRLRLCAPARVDACDFEGFSEYTENTRGAKTALIVETCAGALVSNCNFTTRPIGSGAGTVDEGTRGIWVTDEVTDEGPAGWATVLPNLFQNVAMAVEVGPNASATTVLAQKVRVGAGTTGAIGLRAAGLAVPALPAAQIQIPAGVTGLGYLVYDTDQNVLKCWTDIGWRNLWTP